MVGNAIYASTSITDKLRNRPPMKTVPARLERWLEVLPKIRKQTGLAYAAAIGIFAISLGARLALTGVLPPGLPYFTFFIAVLLATLVGGLGPGLLTLAFSVGAAWHLLLPTRTPDQFQEAIVASLLFAFIGAMIIAVTHLLNRTVERFLKLQDRAETQLYLTAMAEQRLKNLNDELKHRNKNTFALIAALVAQGSRRETDIERFAEALRSRLMAMGTAQDLILSSHFQGTDLKTLVSKTLEPIVPPGPKRLETEGPEFFLPTEIATPLALVIHELGTNGLKYGAWANDTGRISVRWKLDHDTDPETNLILTWAEAGGPKVNRPDRTGFGTLLIERTLPDASVERAFAAGGFTCTITLRIRNLNTLRNGIRMRRDDGETLTLANR